MTFNILAGAMLCCPLLALLFSLLGFRINKIAITGATSMIGLGFILSMSLLFSVTHFVPETTIFLLHFNALNLILVSLVMFVSFIVHLYSRRYMDGNKLYFRYYSLLGSSGIPVVCADLAQANCA